MDQKAEDKVTEKVMDAVQDQLLVEAYTAKIRTHLDCITILKNKIDDIQKKYSDLPAGVNPVGDIQ